MNANYILKVKSGTLESGDRTRYFYASTRSRAMISKLVAETEYAKLMKMDTNEIMRYLGEGEYKKEIDAVGIKATKIDTLERVLNENFANSVNKLLRFTPPSSPVWAYVMRYDIANVKTIIRSKTSKGRKEDVWQKLVPVGTFGKEFLKELIALETKAQVIEALRGTPYYQIVKKNETKTQEEFEDSLEVFYFEILLKSSKRQRAFEKLVRMEIDIRNAFVLLRLKRTKVQNIERFFIKGGRISAQRLLELSRMDEFEIINALKTYPFWKYAPSNTKELDKIDAGLRKFMLIYGWNMKKDYAPTFSALLGFIIAKEREIANIRILARSKTAKNPEDALNIRSKLYIK